MVNKMTLDYSSLSLLVSFRQRSVLIFVYMLLLIDQMWKLLHVVSKVIIIIIIIIITYLLTYLFTYLLTYLITAVEMSLGGSSPYTVTDKTNRNKYT